MIDILNVTPEELGMPELPSTEPDDVYYGIDEEEEVLQNFPDERAAVEKAKKQYGS